MNYLLRFLEIFEKTKKLLLTYLQDILLFVSMFFLTKLIWMTYGTIYLQGLNAFVLLTILSLLLYAISKQHTLFTNGKIVRIICWIILIMNINLLLDNLLIKDIRTPSLLAFIKYTLQILRFSAIGMILLELFNKSTSYGFIAVIISFSIMHFMVITISPSPHIDVFTILQEASDRLFNGINPYIDHYPDIYNGEFTKFYGRPELIYWPLNVLLLSTFKFLLGDIRYTYVFALLATLVGFYFLFDKNKKIYLPISMLLLSIPFSLFELEQAWIETLFFPFIVFTFHFYNQKNFTLTGLFLGLTIGIKQYILFFFIFFLLLVWKEYGFKKSFQTGLVAGIVFLIPFIPFSGDIGLLIERTILFAGRYMARPDSLSYNDYILKNYHFELNSFYNGLIYLTVFIIALISLLINKRKDALTAFMYIQLFMYTLVFAFGKQSFSNYYYFLAGLIIITIGLKYSFGQRHKEIPKTI